MKIIGKEITEKGFAATIGSFDGVHQGHKFVVQQVMEQARARGLGSLVVTFSNHPLKVLRKDFKAQLLTLADEKTELLQQTGVDCIALLEFTKELSQFTAHDFMKRILKEQLNVKVLVIGYDNHFGHDHKSFTDYVEYGKELGIEMVQSKELSIGTTDNGQQTTDNGRQITDDRQRAMDNGQRTKDNGQRTKDKGQWTKDNGVSKVSSTIIRNALLEGDIKTANAVLGFPYYIKGKVVSGFHVGRKIGFPTANIEVSEDKLIPMNGAYCVKVESSKQTFYGMMNIGYRPTLDNGPQRSIEVNLFHCDEDLYGTELRIEFLHFLRPEHKFNNIDELIAQLEKDKQQCEDLLKYI